MQNKIYYVYILSSRRNGTLYVGITSDLQKRAREHKNKFIEKSFTARYSVNRLVYYESFENINVAIIREKQLKNWRRKWKLNLIEKENQHWIDLAEDNTQPGSRLVGRDDK